MKADLLALEALKLIPRDSSSIQSQHAGRGRLVIHDTENGNRAWHAKEGSIQMEIASLWHSFHVRKARRNCPRPHQFLVRPGNPHPLVGFFKGRIP